MKERGFTLDGAKQKLKGNKEDTVNNVEIVNRLNRVRSYLLELKTNL